MSKRQLKALVVDDDPIVRRTLEFALVQEGFSCSRATDGNEALAILNAERCDLVVTDLRMPGKHGHALAVEVLAREDRPLLVVHSSVNDPRLVKDLMARGVDDFIQKPTNYRAFAAKIKMMVNRQRKSESQAADSAQPCSDRQREPEIPRGEKEKAGDLDGHRAAAFSDNDTNDSGRATIEPGEATSHGTPEVAFLSEHELKSALEAGGFKSLARTDEQRSAGRWSYPAREMLAACAHGRLPDSSAFREVLCHEISKAEISFFLSQPPVFQFAVVTIAKSREASWLIRVSGKGSQNVNGEQSCLVSSRFVKRVSGRELLGGPSRVC